MRFPTHLLVSIGLAAGACTSVKESTYNPMNWGESDVETAPSLAPETGYVTIEDFRGLVAQVTKLAVVNSNGGVIVHATGLPATQGYFNADLFPLNDEKPDGRTLVYEFRVVEPFGNKRVGSEISRDIVVAHFISSEKLRGVSEIKVIAAQNSRSSRAQ